MNAITLSVAVTVTSCGVAAGLQAQGRPDHAVSGLYNKSLGVECAHCHTGTDFADASNPTFDFAQRMERMVRGINDGPLKALGGVTPAGVAIGGMPYRYGSRVPTGNRSRRAMRPTSKGGATGLTWR